MSAIDPRFAARRQAVREESASHRLRWMLASLALLGLALGAWWLVQSPYLAVERISVTGAQRAAVSEALARAGLEEGMSVVMVRTGRVEEALRADPWVRDAAVGIDFPHLVEIAVLEYRPFAVVATADGGRLVASDGAVLAEVETPPEGFGVVADAVAGRPGSLVDDPATAAGLAFLARLDPGQRATARIAVGREALLATVSGRTVLLGTRLDIEAKAAVAATLLAAGVDEGWSLDVSAPGRPALVPPQLPALPEPEDEAATEALPEGQGG